MNAHARTVPDPESEVSEFYTNPQAFDLTLFEEPEDFEAFAEDCGKVAERTALLLWVYEGLWANVGPGRDNGRVLNVSWLFMGMIGQWQREMHQGASCAEAAARESRAQRKPVEFDLDRFMQCFEDATADIPNSPLQEQIRVAWRAYSKETDAQS